MKINPRELRDKGIEYCKAHGKWIACEGCPLDDHSMCINDNGELSMNDCNVDLIVFCRDFNKMVKKIYGEEAADE